MYFERVAIIGVGLIGGSFGLALKEAKRCGHVVGIGRTIANLKKAADLGAIDSYATDIEVGARDADLILVATPVSFFRNVFIELKPNLKPDAVVTDGGSTKRDVVRAARAVLRSQVSQFVPAHPIAGAEKSGAAAAKADLFRDKRVVLTPLPQNSTEAVRRVSAAWGACGARLSKMTPEEHDEVFAAVSHLPHLLAYALVGDIAARRNAAQLFGYAAGGFRDFTRIASSHPEMWRDICVANRDKLARELRSFEKRLGRMKVLLRLKDGRRLEKSFAKARAARERWLKGDFQ
jgi:prephenate dehydrogenase